jgi:hypothetical protein
MFLAAQVSPLLLSCQQLQVPLPYLKFEAHRNARLPQHQLRHFRRMASAMPAHNPKVSTRGDLWSWTTRETLDYATRRARGSSALS